jgi:hypothetical protein
MRLVCVLTIVPKKFPMGVSTAIPYLCRSINRSFGDSNFCRFSFVCMNEYQSELQEAKIEPGYLFVLAPNNTGSEETLGSLAPQLK